VELRGESIELGEVFAWQGDLVVLSVGHEPSEGAEEISNMLFFPRDKDSFNIEHNYHVDLLDNRGVAFVGTAQGPRFIRHSLSDARREAFELSEFFKSKILSRDVRSIVNEARCAGCGTCVELCPYDAITLNTIYDFDREEYKKIAVVDVNSCQGCGACASGCPASAPTLQKYSVEQLWRQLEELIS
jgi:heterodisulfide reductase subunit A